MKSKRYLVFSRFISFRVSYFTSVIDSEIFTFAISPLILYSIPGFITPNRVNNFDSALPYARSNFPKDIATLLTASRILIATNNAKPGNKTRHA